jgi:hypothetical protein
MSLTSMKRSMKERKLNKGDVPMSTVLGEKYPWGLQITLEKESLKKLGLSADSFDIDAPVFITAKTEVTSISKNEAIDGESRESVGLQIVAMDVSRETPKTAKDSGGTTLRKAKQTIK